MLLLTIVISRKLIFTSQEIANNCIELSVTSTSEMSSHSPSNQSAGRPRSNSYASSVKEIQLGTKVLIIETENVVQRARHLIGKIGTVCEVPGTIDHKL